MVGNLCVKKNCISLLVYWSTAKTFRVSLSTPDSYSFGAKLDRYVTDCWEASFWGRLGEKLFLRKEAARLVFRE